MKRNPNWYMARTRCDKIHGRESGAYDEGMLEQCVAESIKCAQWPEDSLILLNDLYLTTDHLLHIIYTFASI